MASANSPKSTQVIAGATTIDGLEILDELGRGAENVVYRAVAASASTR